VAIDPACDVVFVPADPPRDGLLAVLGQGPDHLELVVQTGSTTRRRDVAARFVPLPAALPGLLSVDRDKATPTLAAWSTAATAAVQLVARGRLLPAASPAGFDAWRVGPLDAADDRLLRELSAAFPALAHALPLEQSRPLRLRSAEALVHDL
jgi:hypothetical protein